MALKIGVVSQKGGVGKSTLARVVACEYAANGWNVKLADMDNGQGTSHSWHRRRLENTLEPEISVEEFRTIERALRVEDHFDLLVFDGAPRATKTTKRIAELSALSILPTGVSVDDLEPTILLAHELKNAGIPRERLAIALSRVGDSEAELAEARDYIATTGYFLLDGYIPERTGYRRASDTGRSLTETPFASLNERAAELVQSIVNRIQTLEEA